MILLTIIICKKTTNTSFSEQKELKRRSKYITKPFRTCVAIYPGCQQKHEYYVFKDARENGVVSVQWEKNLVARNSLTRFHITFNFGCNNSDDQITMCNYNAFYQCSSCKDVCAHDCVPGLFFNIEWRSVDGTI